MKTLEYYLHCKTVYEDGTSVVILSVEDKSPGKESFLTRQFTVAPDELMHIEVSAGEIRFVSLAKTNPNSLPGLFGTLIK